MKEFFYNVFNIKVFYMLNYRGCSRKREFMIKNNCILQLKYYNSDTYGALHSDFTRCQSFWQLLYRK